MHRGKMKQNTLTKLMFIISILTVLTGAFLLLVESSATILILMIACVLYTLIIATFVALDNKYFLTKVSGLWLTNLEVPRPEYDFDLIGFNDKLHRLNLETQKSIDQTRDIAYQIINIKDKMQTLFIGTLSSKKYHNKDCRIVRNIKTSNKVNFKFERDARNNGFTKCKCFN